MANPSVSLAVWASAWLAGRAAPDDVIDALIAWAPRHLVTAYDAVAAGHTGLSWPDMDDNGPIGLLQTIRTATGQPHGLPDIHVILPAPGDPRGLPAGTQFQRDAMEASEAIILSDRQNDSTAIGLVPAVEYDEDRDETTGLSWTVYSLPAKIPPQPAQDLGEAEFQLRQAVRAATATLGRLDRAVGATEADPVPWSRRCYPRYAGIACRTTRHTARFGSSTRPTKWRPSPQPRPRSWSYPAHSMMVRCPTLCGR